MGPKGMWLIAMALVVGAVAVAVGFQSAELRADDLTLFGRLLGTLVIVAAIMERALDTFLTVLRGQEGDETAARVERSRERLLAKEKEPGVSAADLEKLEEDLKSAETARKASRAKTRDMSLTGGLMLGVVISAFGFRALEALVSLEGVSVSQQKAFAFLDVILTGAVLAGGSDGLHKLVEVYRHVTEKSSGNK